MSSRIKLRLFATRTIWFFITSSAAVFALFSTRARLNHQSESPVAYALSEQLIGEYDRSKHGKNCSLVDSLHKNIKLVRSPHDFLSPFAYVDTPDGKRCAFLSERFCSDDSLMDGILWAGNLFDETQSIPKRTASNSQQVWFAVASETNAPPYQTRPVGDPKWMEGMNYAQHYGTNADFPVDTIYGIRSWPEADPKILENKMHSTLYLSSNCGVQSERDDFVRRASLFMDISSPGACAHNVDFPPRLIHLEKDSDNNSLRQTWKDYGPGLRAILADYRFRIVIISTLCEDYWADGEKVYQTLEAGTIPIYLGMPNSHDWDPGIAAGVHPAMIHTQDFEGLQELADFVHDLGSDSEEALKRRRRYREYEGLSPVQFPRHSEYLLNKTRGMNWNQFVCQHTHDGNPQRRIEVQAPCRGSWWQYLEGLGKNLSRWGCTESDPCTVGDTTV